MFGHWTLERGNEQIQEILYDTEEEEHKTEQSNDEVKVPPWIPENDNDIKNTRSWTDD